MIIVEKAFAYITNGARLLVFTHAEFPDAGVQVPAGTIRHGESPGSAVVREVHEETGLSMFTTVAFLGMTEFDARPHGKDEMHRRHFFHLPYTGLVPDYWRHYERHASDAAHEPIAFDFHWLRLIDAATSLSFGHGAFIGALQNRI